MNSLGAHHDSNSIVKGKRDRQDRAEKSGRTRNEPDCRGRSGRRRAYQGFRRPGRHNILRPQIAHGKAYGALAMGMGSRAINRAADERPNFATAINALAGGSLVPVPGGGRIRSKAGAVIGAVGITGDTSDNDEACAVAGIEAAGYAADAG